MKRFLKILCWITLFASMTTNIFAEKLTEANYEKVKEEYYTWLTKKILEKKNAPNFKSVMTGSDLDVFISEVTMQMDYFFKEVSDLKHPLEKQKPEWDQMISYFKKFPYSAPASIGVCEMIGQISLIQGFPGANESIVSIGSKLEVLYNKLIMHSAALSVLAENTLLSDYLEQKEKEKK